MSKVYIDNDKKAILYNGDYEPTSLCVNGEVMTDISYIQDTADTNPAQYKSEYKNNILKAQIDGNSTQEAYEGYNLFDKRNVLKNKCIFVDRSEFETMSTETYGCIIIPCLPNTTYIKQGNFGATTTAYLDSNKSFLQPAISVNISTPFTTPADCYYMVFNVAKEYAPYDDCQVVKGNQEKSYEPFVGGKASPSPDFPQEILSANNSQEIIDYTDAIMSRLAEDINYYSGGVTGVFMVKLPDELIGQDITFSTDGVTETYSIGLIDGKNWLFGNSVELASPNGYKDITTKDYNYIYITGALGEAEAVAFFSTYNVYAKKVVDKDNKIMLQLSGVNLFDINNYELIGLSAYNLSMPPRIENGIIESAGIRGNYTGAMFKIDTVDISNITVSFNAEFDTATNPNTHLALYVSNEIDEDNIMIGATSLLTLNAGKVKNGANTFTVDVSDYNYLGIGFFATKKYGIKVSYLQVEKGTTRNDYEPYIEPQTVEIPKEIDLDGTIVPLNFAKIEDVADTLVIDNINKSVIYNSNIAYKEFSGQEYFPRTFKVYDYGGEPILDYNTTAFGGSLNIGNLASVVCNYVKGLASHRVISYHDLGVCVGESNRLFFRLPREVYGATTESTNDELSSLFKQWVQSLKDSGNPMYAFWVKRTPTSYDLTNTDLGKSLLEFCSKTKNQTNIITTETESIGISKQDVAYAIWGGR